MFAWVYILRLKSGGQYIGSSTDIECRYAEHMSGHACRTTRIDPPIKLIYAERFDALPGAKNRESQLKRWTRAKKEALISGDKEALTSLSRSRKSMP